MNDTDRQLVHRYARQHAEDAFAEIVRRHLNLVFSTAVRQVRSRQLAEEVAQSVFIDLARQAKRLAPDTILSAWLYQVTNRTAIDVVRREARRALREQVSVELADMNATSADWSEIGPLLDEAMNALNGADRTAILLRYFENKSLREVGQLLCTTEDAARKRLSRAIERLREFFAKRDISVGTSGLASMISTNGIQAAPVGLAANITTGALSAVTATTAVVGATKALGMTTLQKSIIATTAAVLVGAGIHQACKPFQLRQKLQIAQQQQESFSNQIQELTKERDTLASTLAAADGDKEHQRQRKEYLELLSLRGRVRQLTDELHQLRTPETGLETTPNSTSKPHDEDSILFSASLTNRIESGKTLVAGGWSMDGMRGYVLITPAIRRDNQPPDAHPLALQSMVIEGPETFWNQIGWGDVKSDARRSTVAGVLTAEQVAALLSSLKATEGCRVSNTSLAEGDDGQKIGLGYSREDETGTGALMGIDVYPRIGADGQSVELAIRPSPLSTNTAVYPALKAAEPPVHAAAP